MSNCALSFLRGIWSFIMGSLRIIFFFFCLLFIIVQLCILILLTRHSFNINDIQLPTLTPGSSEYLRLLFMLFLSLLGAYGAFYKHAASIKMVSKSKSFNHCHLRNRITNSNLKTVCSSVCSQCSNFHRKPKQWSQP